MKAVGFVARGFVVAALIGCSAAPESSPSGGVASPSAPAAATASPPSTPGPTAAQRASPVPTATGPAPASLSPASARPSPAEPGRRWELLVDHVPPHVANLVGFDDGYVGYGLELELWFSVDGVDWERRPLPPHEPQCDDDGSEVIEMARTDGQSVILLGAYATPDCDLQTFAWFSADGRSWQFSSVGAPRRFSEAEPVDAWPIPGGWEAAIANYDPGDPARDATAIWHSPDGMNWTQTATVAGHGNVDGAADANGNRLLSVTARITTAFGPPASQVRLVTSADGVTWTDVQAQLDRAGDVAVVAAIEPPTGDRSTWLLFVDEYDEHVSSDDSFIGGTVWLSGDLSEWEPVSPPKARTFPQAATSHGLIATACERALEQCAMYLTRDGREWKLLNSEFLPDLEQWVAEGPAGVLAVTDERAVYQLRP